MEKKTRVVIGIDPGKNGAIAVVSVETEELLSVERSPDLVERAVFLKSLLEKYDVVFAVLEKAQVMIRLPKKDQKKEKEVRLQSPKSAFTFGVDFGVWYGILLSLGLKFEVVAPHVWYRKVVGSTRAKSRSETKRLTRQKMEERFSELREKRISLDLIDSVALALYARLSWLGLVSELPKS